MLIFLWIGFASTFLSFVEAKPIQRNINTYTYTSNRSITSKQLLNQDNQKNNFDKSNSNYNINLSRNIEKRNEKSNNLTGNKTYRTFTYTSSKQDNLNSGRNNTSIIITSSKMNEDANNALNKGRIHHMISVRNPNIRSNSTSSNDYLNKNEDKASNTTNNGFRNSQVGEPSVIFK